MMCRRCGSEDTVVCEHKARDQFRTCLSKYRQILDVQGCPGSISTVRREGSTMCARPAEEFLCDFEIIGRRTAPAVWKAIMLMYVGDNDPYSPAVLKVRGALAPEDFRAAVEQAIVDVGRAFADTRPYPLFPPSSYLDAPGRQEKGTTVTMDMDGVWRQIPKYGPYVLPDEDERKLPLAAPLRKYVRASDVPSTREPNGRFTV